MDASVLLRLILGEPGQLHDWRHYDRRVCSDLAEVECLRTLDRLRLQGPLSQNDLLVRRTALYHMLQSSEVVEMSRPILRRASGSLPVVLGTLDALHLATALIWRDEQGSDLVVATHDRALGAAARAHGMEVVGI